MVRPLFLQHRPGKAAQLGVDQGKQLPGNGNVAAGEACDQLGGMGDGGRGHGGPG